MEYISTNDDLIIDGKLFTSKLFLKELGSNDDVATYLLNIQSDVANASNMININHADLEKIRNNGSLIPGRQYRIIDYVTTTTQADKTYSGYNISNTQSAGHQFDIIVTADSANKLNENAKAIQHEGEDTYFNNSNLAAWELKYCLDNDTSRFGWADEKNGKGVIYYMKDEFGNECSYDFKNIQFQRKFDKNGNYVPENGTTNDNSDESILEWCYTFGGHLYDSSLSISEDFKTFNNNVIGSFNFDNTFWLPDNVFLDTTYGVSASCYNILHENCICNTFSYDCCYNELGIECKNNFFDSECYYNTFKNNCCNNIFSYDCNYNELGFNCSGNIFKNGCWYNQFGINCSSNTLDDSCDHNIFGNFCNSNTFKYRCAKNIFSHSCTGNKFEYGCESNTFGDGCNNNTFGDECVNNTFGNGCNNNIFSTTCNFNTFGVCCSHNRLYTQSQSNRFGNNCSNNIFGERCLKNILEENCNYINFISITDGDIYRSYYENITVGQGNEYMLLECTVSKYNTPFKNVRIAPGCCSGQMGPEMNKKVHLDILDGLYIPIDKGDGTRIAYYIKTSSGQNISIVIGKKIEYNGKLDAIFTATMGV